MSKKRTKRVLIRVSKEDIKNGIRRSTTSCPIALALPRYGFATPWVGFSGVRYGVSGPRSFFPLPESACTFVSRFDDGKPVKPFNFYLTLKAL